jgi:hypothetical protein
MWHRVAALLGGRTIAELQQVMTHAEFVDWCAYYQIEPWGYEMDNWRMGVQAATTANAAGRKRPLKPADFMPKARNKRQQSAADIERSLLRVAKKGEADGD